MKIKTNKKTINPLFIVIAVVFIAICGYLGFALKTNLWPFPPTPNAQTKEPLEPERDKTQTTTPQTDKNTGNATTPDEVPANPALSASITQLIQDSNNNILVTAKISGLSSPSTEGTCVITFTNDNDRPYVQQLDSTVKGGETFCGQLSIPSFNFSYLGTWKVNVRFYLDNKQVSTDGIINIH